MSDNQRITTAIVAALAKANITAHKITVEVDELWGHVADVLIPISQSETAEKSFSSVCRSIRDALEASDTPRAGLYRRSEGYSDVPSGNALIEFDLLP